MKKIVLMITLCCVGLLFTGCKHYVGDDESDGVKVDVTADVVRGNIDDLAKAAWDRDNYHAILDEQIPGLADEDTRESLTKNLKDVYAAVLVKEGNTLMDNNGCGPNHTRLNSVMNELKSDSEFKKANGASALLSRYATHSAAIGFAQSISTSVTAASWDSNYDSSYENTKRAQAKSHIAKNPKCNYIKSILSESALKQKFAQRRRNFCNSLVEKFKKRSDHLPREGQMLIDNITRLQGSCPSATEIMNYTQGRSNY